VLLAALKEQHAKEYSSWQVVRFDKDYSYLEYNHIKGGHTPATWAQFVKVVDIVRTAHEAGYIMGDILAQNIVFHHKASDESATATVIDWDMAKAKNTNPCYVAGFVHTGVHATFRHAQAVATKSMEFVHDAWALACLAETWFVGDGLDGWSTKLKNCSYVTEVLVREAAALDCLTKNDCSTIPHAQATGSPVRA
jgi:hypothetical protein